jgi:hypothetical protein
MEIDQFNRDGFLVMKQIAAPADLRTIRTRILALFEAEAGRAEGAFFDFAGSDEDGKQMGLPQLIDVRNYAPELLSTQFFSNASALAREILGPGAKFVADHALAKPAHHGALTPWHQDDAFRDGFYQHNEVSIWLALQDTDESNGCLAFVKGSHLQPVLPHRSFTGNAKVHALECYEGWAESDIEFCPLKAGDCTVHTNRTLHGAGPNISAQPRYGYVLVFGTPPTRLREPYYFEWLQGKQEARLYRRRAWLLRGGWFAHGWRRLKQMRQIGIRESLRRLREKLITRR